MEEDGNASSQFGYNGNKRRRIDNNNDDGSREQGHTKSSARRVRAAGINAFGNSGDLSLRARADIDTKADTVCVGSTFELHEDTGKVVDVHGFHDTLGVMKNITVGTAITAIDLEDETIIGVFPQSLYFGESMKDSFLPPVQMWDYGMVVDVVPKQYSSGKSLHGIYHHDEKIIVPFSIHGCMSYIPTRLPSREEKRTCRWIQFTGEKEWKPYDKKFDLAERAMINHVTEPDLNHQHGYNDNIQINRRSMGRVSVTSQNDNIKDHEPSLYTFDTIYNDNIREAKAINARNHRSKVDDVTLAKRWGVSVDIAKRTR